MPGKKPKERQRYMLRIKDTLVEVTREVYLACIRLVEKSDTRLKKCRGMEYAAWRNYRKKATTALFRYYHRKKSLSGCQRYRNSKKL